MGRACWRGWVEFGIRHGAIMRVTCGLNCTGCAERSLDTVRTGAIDRFMAAEADGTLAQRVREVIANRIQAASA